jgi:hypothetical protein
LVAWTCHESRSGTDTVRHGPTRTADPLPAIRFTGAVIKKARPARPARPHGAGGGCEGAAAIRQQRWPRRPAFCAVAAAAPPPPQRPNFRWSCGAGPSKFIPEYAGGGGGGGGG